MSIVDESPMKERRKSFLLRIDEGLWDDVATWAGQELRSVNGQIELILRRAVEGTLQLIASMQTLPKSPAGEQRRSLRVEHLRQARQPWIVSPAISTSSVSMPSFSISRNT